MTLTVTDEPPDRPQWITETIRLVTGETESRRRRLLERVAPATEADLAMGTDGSWGLGQVAVHLLLIDRGVTLIALRLALGQSAVGATGQPRPAAGSAAMARLRAEFPDTPATATVARHPYYGDLNCFAWLLTLPNHYTAHLLALDAGTPSAL